MKTPYSFVSTLLAQMSQNRRFTHLMPLKGVTLQALCVCLHRWNIPGAIFRCWWKACGSNFIQFYKGHRNWCLSKDRMRFLINLTLWLMCLSSAIFSCNVYAYLSKITNFYTHLHLTASLGGSVGISPPSVHVEKLESWRY